MKSSIFKVYALSAFVTGCISLVQAQEETRTWKIGMNRELVEAKFISENNGRSVELEVKGEKKKTSIELLSGDDKVWVLNYRKKIGRAEIGERAWAEGIEVYNEEANKGRLLNEKSFLKAFKSGSFRVRTLRNALDYMHRLESSEVTLNQMKGRKHEAYVLNDRALSNGVKVWDETLDKNRIQVYPATGLVEFYKSGKVIKSTVVNDKGYMEAVRLNTLDEYTEESTFSVDSRGDYKVPIIVSGFPLFEWGYGTVAERAIRSWTVCIGGADRVNDKPLNSMFSWSLASLVAKYDVEVDDLELIGYKVSESSKEKYLKNHDDKYRRFNPEINKLGWLMAFTSIQPYNIDLGEQSNRIDDLSKQMYFEQSATFFNTDELIKKKSQCLLLGYGLLGGFSKDSRGLAAIVAIEGKDEYIFGGSKVEKMSKGRGRLGKMIDSAIVLVPDRDELGKVVFFPKK